MESIMFQNMFVAKTNGSHKRGHILTILFR